MTKTGYGLSDGRDVRGRVVMIGRSGGGHVNGVLTGPGIIDSGVECRRRSQHKGICRAKGRGCGLGPGNRYGISKCDDLITARCACGGKWNYATGLTGGIRPLIYHVNPRAQQKRVGPVHIRPRIESRRIEGIERYSGTRSKKAGTGRTQSRREE